MDLKGLLKTIKNWIPPVHKEGHVFIGIFAVVTFILLALAPSFIGFLGIVATIWCAVFFRDPERIVPIGDNFIVSPADGIITKIDNVPPPQELGLGDEEVVRVTVFLNIFNVHINRFPVSGTVTALNYHPGKFLSADLDKASVENERQSVVIKTKDGEHTVVCVQIAGLIARRIVCYLEEEQEMQGGERFGLIRFGSRADIYLPAGVNPKVVEGQTAIAGETILADLKSKTKTIKGEIR
jgi:phosphatidylserine decarboxylase